MQPDVIIWGFVIVASLIAAAWAVSFFVDARKARRKYEHAISALTARVEESEHRAQMVVDAERARARAVSTIGAFGPQDGEFLNKLRRFAEMSEAQFMFEQLHRSVYEAALAAPSDDMILNAVKKGKGIRLAEKAVAAPLSLFGMDEQEVDNEVA